MEETEKKPNQNRSFIDRVGNRLEKTINSMDNFESKMTSGLDKLAERAGQYAKSTFEGLLEHAGFNSGCIDGIKQTIIGMTHKPRDIETMDKVLRKFKRA